MPCPVIFSEYSLYIFVSTGSVVSGAGAFEVAVADALIKHKPNVKGRAQLGVQAFADALLVIPKVRRFYLPHRLFTSLYLICYRNYYFRNVQLLVPKTFNFNYDSLCRFWPRTLDMTHKRPY